MKRLLAIMLATALSACSDSRTHVISVPIELDVGRTLDPNAVIMLPVNFRVVTRETVESFMAELSRQQGSSPVFIAITTRDYENMSLNLADLRRYIEQQRAMIVYYRQMTARHGERPN